MPWRYRIEEGNVPHCPTAAIVHCVYGVCGRPDGDDVVLALPSAVVKSSIDAIEKRCRHAERELAEERARRLDGYDDDSGSRRRRRRHRLCCAARCVARATDGLAPRQGGGGLRGAERRRRSPLAPVNDAQWLVDVLVEPIFAVFFRWLHCC